MGSILVCYSRWSIWKYISDALDLGMGCLEKHCKKTDGPCGYSTTRSCWVVEVAPERCKAGHQPGQIIGLIVVRTSTVRANRHWLSNTGVDVHKRTGESNKGLAVIEWMVVDSSFRRQGIAT